MKAGEGVAAGSAVAGAVAHKTLNDDCRQGKKNKGDRKDNRVCGETGDKWLNGDRAKMSIAVLYVRVVRVRIEDAKLS